LTSKEIVTYSNPFGQIDAKGSLYGVSSSLFVMILLMREKGVVVVEHGVLLGARRPGEKHYSILFSNYDSC
jgi:hypothetical protein